MKKTNKFLLIISILGIILLLVHNTKGIITEPYVPNSTGGQAWKGKDCNQVPLDIVSMKDTQYSNNELATISLDDNNYVTAPSGFNMDCIDITGNPYEYGSTVIKFKIEETVADINNISIRLATTTDDTYLGNIFLYSWNFSANSWIQLDSDACNDGGGPPSPVRCNLTGVLTYAGDFVNSSGDLYIYTTTDISVQDSLVYYAEAVVDYTIPAEDTCTYSGSGNWIVDCSDNCNITSDVNLLGNNLTLYGSGLFRLMANLTGYDTIFIENGCELFKEDKYAILPY